MVFILILISLIISIKMYAGFINVVLQEFLSLTGLPQQPCPSLSVGKSSQV